ncbi:MAG: DUF4388 domain-containing protein [Deltaproteobacteria bacterium]|nr:DUF4388 domain-containing protein [Deltaproteobacteria bacterium]
MNQTQAGKGLNADLENFELTDVMQLITQQVKCGILSVEGNDGSCSWSFNEGYLVDFSCQFTNHALDLKIMLVNSGQLDPQGLPAFSEKNLAERDHELEKALLKSGVLSREELERANLRRLIESFIITLQWTKGKYKFIPTSEITKRAFFPPQDTNFIILEALRQIDEMAVMKKRLLPLERIYESTLALNRDESSARDNVLFEEGLESQFDRDELGVYNLFNGKRSLAEILQISIIGQYHTCRIILDFFDRGIIAPRTAGRDPLQKEKSDKSFKNLAGPALVLLSAAVISALFITGRLYENPRKTTDLTFFSAIIDNLKAEQKQARQQARDLLR